MSALGQKRTWRDQIEMSALPPIADIPRREMEAFQVSPCPLPFGLISFILRSGDGSFSIP
jgi:hypothetical protein